LLSNPKIKDWNLNIDSAEVYTLISHHTAEAPGLETTGQSHPKVHDWLHKSVSKVGELLAVFLALRVFGF
jgi:hypothetical protein